MMLNDYTLPNKDLRVSMSMRIDSGDLSGQNSGTGSAHKGFKPKIFNVSLMIPFAEPEALGELIAVAESTRADGSLTIYDITEDLANAIKVRQVQFTEEFYVRELDSLKAWSVQFALRDYLSVPEKVEQRQVSAAPQAQTASGEVIAASESSTAGESTTAGDGEPQQISWFERQLAKADKALS